MLIIFGPVTVPAGYTAAGVHYPARHGQAWHCSTVGCPNNGRPAFLDLTGHDDGRATSTFAQTFSTQHPTQGTNYRANIGNATRVPGTHLLAIGRVHPAPISVAAMGGVGNVDHLEASSHRVAEDEKKVKAALKILVEQNKPRGVAHFNDPIFQSTLNIKGAALRARLPAREQQLVQFHNWDGQLFQWLKVIWEQCQRK